MLRRHALYLLCFSLLLSGCVQRLPATQPRKAQPLLQALADCGAAGSLACGKIHLALARQYLEQPILTRTSVAAANSELNLAAQNPALATQIEPWRRLTASWLKLAARPSSPDGQQSASTATLRAQLQQLKAENAAHQEKLAQLNSLLHSEAKKSLGEKAP